MSVTLFFTIGRKRSIGTFSEEEMERTVEVVIVVKV